MVEVVEVVSCPLKTGRHVHQILHPGGNSDWCSSRGRMVLAVDSKRAQEFQAVPFEGSLEKSLGPRKE